MNKNDKNYIILSSMSMDLVRVANGFYRGSNKMAERFLEEAKKRKKEIDIKLLKPYMKIRLDKFNEDLFGKNKMQVAENALLYSVLLRNYVLSEK